MNKVVDRVYVDWVKVNAGILEKAPVQNMYVLIVLSTSDNFVWLERLDDNTPLTLMFGMLKSFQAFKDIFHIEIKTVITDKKNGLYVHSGKRTHPVERLMIETKLRHIAHDAMDDKLMKFEQMLQNGIIDEGPYADTSDFETYLVDFMSYYNHPDITELFPSDNTAQMDMNVDEDVISQKIEKLLKSIDAKKPSREDGGSVITIRKESDIIDNMMLPPEENEIIEEEEPEHIVLKEEPVKKKRIEPRRKTKLKFESKPQRRTTPINMALVRNENEWDFSPNYFDMTEFGLPVDPLKPKKKKKRKKKKKSIEDNFLFF